MHINYLMFRLELEIFMFFYNIYAKTGKYLNYNKQFYNIN